VKSVPRDVYVQPSRDEWRPASVLVLAVVAELALSAFSTAEHKTHSVSKVDIILYTTIKNY